MSLAAASRDLGRRCVCSYGCGGCGFGWVGGCCLSWGGCALC